MYIISLLRLTITKILFEFIESKKGKNTVNSITREEKVEEYCKLRVFLIYRKKEKIEREAKKKLNTSGVLYIYIYIYITRVVRGLHSRTKYQMSKKIWINFYWKRK